MGLSFFLVPRQTRFAIIDGSADEFNEFFDDSIQKLIVGQAPAAYGA
jgi:hypothetical protein